MPMINIEDAFILDETGAQVDKVTGLFTKDEGTTEGEKAFAQLNIGTAGSNRNLLDNPWFTEGNVVNQKGFSSMDSAGGYTKTVDRWLVNSSRTTLGSDGITIEPTANDYGLLQRMERSRLIANETYTLSVVINGTLYTNTFVWNSNKYLPNFYGTVRAYIGSPNDDPFALWIVGRPGDSFTISKIKLELGSVSTLANDAPPDYGTELLKCMRYLLRISNTASYTILGNGMAGSASVAYIQIPTPVTMRVVPSVSVTNIADLRLYCNGVAVSFTSLAVRGMSANGVTLTASGASGMAANHAASLTNVATEAYIDLSADL